MIVMQWNRLVTLGVVVLMLTAGCLGGGTPADGGAAGDDEREERTPDGSSAGAVDGPELTDPEAALRDAGSFTVTWQYAGVDASGTRTEVRHEYYADLRGERSLTRTSSVRDGQPEGTTEQFVADGTTYLRTGPADAPSYAAYPGTADVVGTAIALSQARAYGANEDMTNRGTEQFDGVTVTRYELSEADSQLIQAGSAATSGAPGTAEITDFHYVVLVDADGLSRYESWSFTGRTAEGQTVSGEWEYSLTTVGSTPVEDPEWLAAAQATANA
jgi:hypothetical protein